MGCKCSCGEVGTLYFPCSGAADVSGLADQVARRLQKYGKGKMYCLAGIGAVVSGMIESTRSAKARVVIDGCPVACGKKAFEKAGIEAYSFILTDVGF